MSSKRLQRVVRVRRLLRTTRAAELARSEADLQGAEQRLGEAEQAITDLDAQGHAGVDPLVEESSIRYRRALESRRVHRAAEVRDREGDVDEQRRSVEGAHRDVRLIEKLQQKVRHREDRAAATAEGREQDAIALAGHTRNGGQSR